MRPRYMWAQPSRRGSGAEAASRAAWSRTAVSGWRRVAAYAHRIRVKSRSHTPSESRPPSSSLESRAAPSPLPLCQAASTVISAAASASRAAAARPVASWGRRAAAVSSSPVACSHREALARLRAVVISSSREIMEPTVIIGKTIHKKTTLRERRRYRVCVEDAADRLVEVWARELDSLDPVAEAIFVRLSILARHQTQLRRDMLAAGGLQHWQFKVLLMLRRSGPPYTVSP